MTVNESHTNPVAPMATAEPEERFILPSTAEGFVKSWVAQDLQYDESEWQTAEEMEERLLEAADFDLSPEEIRQVIAEHAPNAPHRVERTSPKPPQKLPPYPPELELLVQSGVVFLSALGPTWMLRRCTTCGKLDGSCGHSNATEELAVRSPENELDVVCTTGCRVGPDPRARAANDRGADARKAEVPCT